MVANKYPRSGVQEITVSGTSGSATGTHTSDYEFDGFISNISVRARHTTTHVVDTTQGGATINIALH